MQQDRSNILTVHPELTDLPPLAMEGPALDEDFLRYFNRTLGRDRQHCTNHYLYEALAYAVRDRLMERWKATRAAYEKRNARRTCYLSLEFLMGRALGNAMLNLDITDAIRELLHRYGIALEELAEAEHDAGLGNGGLGRLAACFLDSCATLQLPVLGYGLRYEYGMFRQEIVDGRQVEEPDHWLRDGHVWELERPEYTQRIHFGGRTEFYRDQDGQQRVRWVDTHDVLAVPYDVPVPGYRNDTVNSLRLWSASSTDEFDLDDFNAGDYDRAVESKYDAEHITMVLYPNDASENGKELRLRQQYFLASASLKDVLRRHLRLNGTDFEQLAERNCFQLNDTHPSIAVAELMRLLVDEQRLDWDRAWSIVTRSMAYTNHTLLPEALERWPVYLFEKLLPRLLEIIYEINARFLDEVGRRWPGDADRLQRMSLIEEGDTPMVRMAWLAIVGSFSVNGVAGLHSRLLTEGLFRDFYELWPEKFNNKTNGVTQRRWLAMCNPQLNRLITERIGDGWVTDLAQLRQLEAMAEDADFQRRWREVKQFNKQRLATLVRDETGVVFDPEALFDIQVKRIHEYKRQLLNCLHVIHLYARIKRGDTTDWTPRCVLIGGKAAPGYAMAKLIIRLINNVARVVNGDPDVGDRLRVVFLPNYRVSSMELICPGADLSEQISTAGKEASGTGNMKFMMNGAITIGTYDGANIEILDEVGDDNFFRFGLSAEEVAATRADYRPQAIIDSDPDLQQVMELLQDERFSPGEPGLFAPLIRALTSPDDPWLTLADFRSYADAQAQAAAAYRDPARWTRMSIINSARSGRFSTDRTMQEYNRDIWKLEATPPEAL
ncbi:alpha-1,4 glucan phosphorylase [Thiohalobacter sp. COW1]|uniref:glycogen/starch/alpha-glucan phosphorylase n=1 Tax=Thiohalobacter sp. COW1 TaxID=2795687 RepID=UPI001936AE86|nr:glycogen/starch/alpha-glucan phosphorylase [Thiohalobacter sp. COW1]BCO30197.1 alpha-1,4 glucan phosphorylase [Thiohalobacter sp. COW1]